MLDKSLVLEDFEKIIDQLDEVLNMKKTEVVRDSAIKRFELCFDLAWKSIKVCAKIQGAECYSPKACFKTAFQLKLIEYDEKWSDMVDDRNLSSHTYKEELAEEVYSKLSGYLSLFKDLLQKLKED